MRTARLRGRRGSVTVHFEPEAPGTNEGRVVLVEGDPALRRLLDRCAERGVWTPMGAWCAERVDDIPAWMAVVAVVVRAHASLQRLRRTGTLVVDEGPDPFVLESVPGRIY